MTGDFAGSMEGPELVVANRKSYCSRTVGEKNSHLDFKGCERALFSGTDRSSLE